MAGRTLKVKKKKQILFPITLRSLEESVLCLSLKLKHDRSRNIYALIETIHSSDVDLRSAINATPYQPGEHTKIDAVLQNHEQEVSLAYDVNVDLESLVKDEDVPDDVQKQTDSLFSGGESNTDKIDVVFNYLRRSIKYSLVPMYMVDNYASYLREHVKTGRDLDQAMVGYMGYLKRTIKQLMNKSNRSSLIPKLEKDFETRISHLHTQFMKTRYRPNMMLKTVAFKFLNFVADKWDLFFENVWDSGRLYDLDYHLRNGGYCRVKSVLMTRMLASQGFQSVIVDGFCREEGHAWNYVNYGGKWRHMDVTHNSRNLRNQDYTIGISIMPRNADITEAVAIAKSELRRLEKYGLLTSSKPNSQ